MSTSLTAGLVGEHESVLRVVAAMEHEIEEINRTGMVDAARITMMLDFTRNFTDGTHHAKEERVLFPLLEQVGPTAAGPVCIMLSEHDAGRVAVKGIADALPDAGWHAAARTQVVENLGLYAQLLRLHIHKENTMLFPLAEQVLDEPARAAAAGEFARLDAADRSAGVTERYLKMADQLARGHETA